MSSQTKFKKDKEIIAEYETQVKATSKIILFEEEYSLLSIIVLSPSHRHCTPCIMLLACIIPANKVGNGNE
ncbi:unnamed protein product [Caretta caretta]